MWNLTFRWLLHLSKALRCKMISWRLEITFCIFRPIILGIRALFGPSFPKVPWCPKYPKTGETLPSNGFYTWISLQLMWNVDFNTFNEFLYIQAHIWGILFEPNFLDLLPCPKYTKTGIYKSALRWSLHLSKVLFDKKCGV